MTKDKSIKVRLTEKEFELLVNYAKSQVISVPEVIRDNIKRLPKTDSLRSIYILVAIHLTRLAYRCDGSPLAPYMIENVPL
jgi:hypothetical protein